MSDIEARVRIDLTSRQFEISGSTEFVTEMLPALRDLFKLDGSEQRLAGPVDVDSNAQTVPGSNAVESREPAPTRRRKRSQRKTEQPADGTVNGNPGVEVRAARRPTRPVTVAPIPVDLAASGVTPSLADFVKQKEPSRQNNQELVTVFAYYLIRLKGQSHVQPGHIVACYTHLGIKRPNNLPAVLRNVRNRFQWLQSGAEPGSYVLSVAGDNFVEHDLPKK